MKKFAATTVLISNVEMPRMRRRATRFLISNYVVPGGALKSSEEV
jgi:hypothetical protein